MAKVLLIEPKKVLQQAIGLFLFPEHEVKIEGEIGPAVSSLKDYDLLIVDGAALRECNQLTPDALRAIQGCKTPTLWLEEDAASQSPKRDQFVVVKKPIEKEMFEAAVTGFLSPGIASGRSGLALARPGKGSAAKGAAKKRPVEASKQSSFQFIDLVDVVEEQPSPKQGKRAPRKSK